MFRSSIQDDYRKKMSKAMRIIRREKKFHFIEYRSKSIHLYFSFFLFFSRFHPCRSIIISSCSLRVYVLLYTYAHTCETSVFTRREIDERNSRYTYTTTISLSKGSIENTRKDVYSITVGQSLKGKK